MAPATNARTHSKKKSHGIAVGTFDQLANATMTPASRARAKKEADKILGRMSLEALRKDRNMTQSKLAAAMDTVQTEISKIEKRSGVRLGTLHKYVNGLGGHLEVRAVFPDKNVELDLRA